MKNPDKLAEALARSGAFGPFQRGAALSRASRAAKPTIFDILADGLDASVDGRGWDARHEAARILANAALDMLEALKRCAEELPRHRRRKFSFDLELAISTVAAAIAKAEGSE